MDHTGHVEGDLGKQKVPDDILHAYDQTEQDLTHEQAYGSNEIRLGDRLRLILHDCYSLTLNIRRPVRRVDPGHVLQERGDRLQFFGREIELRHAAATRDTVLRPAHDEALDALFAAQALKGVAQFGCEICPLAKQGMTTDTVVHLPQMLALGNYLGEVFVIVSSSATRYECRT